MTGWRDDKKWSDVFLPEIKMFLGLHLIGEPAVEEDELRNTDLIVLKMAAVRIACRVRRYQYFENRKYVHEFTIRSGRPRGTKTELDKILDGWGDYIFYGFADKKETSLVAGWLGELDVFRKWYQDCSIGGNLPGVELNNRDCSSDFRAFDRNKMPKPFIGGRWFYNKSLDLRDEVPWPA